MVFLKSLEGLLVDHHSIFVQATFSRVELDVTPDVLWSLLFSQFGLPQFSPLCMHAWVNVLLDVNAFVEFLTGLETLSLVQHGVPLVPRSQGDQYRASSLAAVAAAQPPHST